MLLSAVLFALLGLTASAAVEELSSLEARVAPPKRFVLQLADTSQSYNGSYLKEGSSDMTPAATGFNDMREIYWPSNLNSCN